MKIVNAFKAFFNALREPQIELPAQTPPSEATHLRLLAILQQSSRLLDFLKEDISAFSDAQVGAAVRKIHQDCSQSLEELVTIRPIFQEAEGATVQVTAGYNPAEIKIIGKGHTEPPLKGKLVHKGWKAHKQSLPKKAGEQSSDILAPAEIEVS